MIPGDPARVLAGTDADTAGLEEIREKYGLKDPIPVQYLRWIGLARSAGLGEAIRTRPPARDVAGGEEAADPPRARLPLPPDRPRHRHPRRSARRGEAQLRLGRR